jgi:hypothetical protein
MSPRSSALAAVLALGLLAPASAAAKSCNVQRDADEYGVSYITSLKVTNVGCPGGKKVVRAFHKCRKANGGIKGRCTAKVLGYSCREERSAIKTQITGKVTCRNGSRRVIHTYTQFT